MSTQPPPASDDPFEVLGIAPDADETTVRRAYVRLIRVWRPERHPEVFQRIQEAYEVARELAQARADYADWNDDEDDDVGPITPTSTSADRTGEALGRAWRYARDGELEAAQAVLGTLQEESDATLLTLHRYLLTDLAEGPSAAAQQLARETQGPQARTAMELMPTLLGARSLRRRARQLPLGPEAWPEDLYPDAIATLFASRVDGMLLAGEVEALADEVESRAFQRHAEDIPDLQFQALRIAAVLSWQDRERADRIATSWPGPEWIADMDWPPEDHQQLANDARTSYQRWLRTRPRPATLRRLIEAGPMLSDESLADLMSKTQTYQQSYDRAFAEHVLELADEVPRVVEGLQITRHLRVVEEHPPIPDARIRCHKMLDVIEPRVSKGLRYEDGSTWVGIAWLGGVIYLMVQTFWIGLLVALVTFVGVMGFLLDWWRKRRFKKRVRALIPPVLHKCGLPPIEVAAVLKDADSDLEELLNFVDEILEDRGLCLYSDLLVLGDEHRLSRLRAKRND